MEQKDLLDLLKQFDVPVPRYTSYPTVPYWDSATLNEENWKQSVSASFLNENGELCIYIHLPFCENLCTFCACNKRITKNHGVEDPYINAVLKEWALYRAFLPGRPMIREIHLGGGTPTFFSPDNLLRLIQGITEKADIAEGHEFSVEVHPNHTTEEHLRVLASVGFNRISLGIQDFDPVVQLLINRVQTFEKTLEVAEWARKHGYNSLNVDIIYGLPRQTRSSVDLTIDYLSKLRPDRIAFYSYAHVPWKSKVQRRYTDQDLPKAGEKWEMYHLGRNKLLAMGYSAIGMDHFALPEDKLFTAAGKGRLHRNFMGYTTTDSKLLIGLGCSSIGDAWNAFAQNEKEVEAYMEKVNSGILPLVNGHVLNSEDLSIRQYILDLMCRNSCSLDPAVFGEETFQQVMEQLAHFAGIGLIQMEGNTIRVLDKGRLFIRNICASLDLRMRRKNPDSNVFSKAI